MTSLDFLIQLGHLRSAFADAVFIGASGLGSEEAYMVLLTTIYLCIGHRYGFSLFAIFLLSAFVNGQVKEALHTVRPFAMYPGLLHPLLISTAVGASFPSGHAQNAAAVWGLVAVRQSTWRRRLIPVALIVVIGFSRLYCQVHWPADVIGGYLIGGLLAFVYLFVVGAWQAAKRQLGLWNGAVVIVAASALMFLVGGGTKVCVQSAGALLGSGVGFVLLEARGGFKAQAPFLTQVLKVALSLGVLAGLRVSAKMLLGEADWATALRYVLIGFTCAYLMPMLFSEYHNWRLRAKDAMEDLIEEDSR